MSELKPWAKDEIRINIDIYFTWKDRIRILFGRNMSVSSRTQTENLPGKLETTVSDVHIERIFKQKRKQGQLEVGFRTFAWQHENESITDGGLRDNE